MAVDAAIGDEAEEVKGFAGLPEVGTQSLPGGVVGELPSGKSPLNAGEVLPHYEARSNVEVPHFRVAHLPFG
jgi:hypothetical protein